jgi:hypothetical protein
MFALLDGNVSYDGNQGLTLWRVDPEAEGIGYQIFIGEYSDADQFKQ